MCHKENKCRLIVDLMSRAVSIVSFAMLPFFFIFTVTKKKHLKLISIQVSGRKYSHDAAQP